MTTPVIAVVGTPNVGKSTLFNALTGLRQRVGNFPGVTVEPVVGTVSQDHKHVQLIDLPGIYSLNPTSEDERLSVDVLRGIHSSIPKPDAILVVLNADNPERCFTLLHALRQLNTPIIVAATMIDAVKAKGGVFDDIGLMHELKSKVVGVVGSKGLGVSELKEALLKQAPLSAGEGRGGEFAESREGRVESGEQSSEWRVESGEQSSEWRGVSGEQSGEQWARKIVEKYVVRGAKDTLTDRADNWLLHPLWGSVAFVIVMAIFFQSIFSWAQPLMQLIESGIGSLQDVVAASMPPSPVRSFIVKGVLAGVGSVVVFLPQILILNIFITVLEECGYLARAAFLVDRFMGLFGLQGRSFIPLLGSFACAIPGIMATRIIPSYKDRLATIMAIPLMTCSARLPVYALLIAAVIPATTVLGFVSLQGLVMAGLFIAGALTGLLIALVMKKTMFRGSTVPFLIEFPPYRMPSLKSVGITVVGRSKDFLTTAGTVILGFSLVLWVLTELPRVDVPTGTTTLKAEQLQLEQSFAADVGRAVQPVFAPLGFDWRITLGVMSSYAARETFVSTMGQIYSADVVESDMPLRSVLSNSMPLATGLSILAYYVFALQCVSTMAIMKRETGTWKWPAIAMVVTFVLAYLASFITYTIASA